MWIHKTAWSEVFLAASAAVFLNVTLVAGRRESDSGFFCRSFLLLNPFKKQAFYYTQQLWIHSHIFRATSSFYTEHQKRLWYPEKISKMVKICHGPVDSHCESQARDLPWGPNGRFWHDDFSKNLSLGFNILNKHCDHHMTPIWMVTKGDEARRQNDWWQVWNSVCSGHRFRVQVVWRTPQYYGEANQHPSSVVLVSQFAAATGHYSSLIKIWNPREILLFEKSPQSKSSLGIT